MLNFKPHSRKDISLRVKWLNNYEAVLYAIHKPEESTTDELQNKWFDDYEIKFERGEKKFFTIYSDDTPIGFMGLSDINTTTGDAKIFILIGEDEYRGRGLGTESIKYLIDYAFNNLNLKSLRLDVKKINLPAINLYNKVGFKKTGEDGEDNQFLLMKLDR